MDNKYDWRLGHKPLDKLEDAEPILPADPPAKWDHEADILVVGSGGGGLAGALKARLEGCSVILLEKMDFTGGTSQYAGAFFAYNSRVQKKAGIEWDVNEVAMGSLFETGYTGNIHLFRNLIKKSGECVDWAEDQGFEWEVERAGYPAVTSKGGHERLWTIPMTDLMNFLAKKGKEKGVKYLINTQVAALVRDNGRIVGVKATVMPEGTTIFVKAKKAVIMAAGGMQHNLSLIKQYAPSIYKGVGSVSMALPSNTGECFRMGLGVGADTSGFDSCSCFEGGIDHRTENGGPWFRFLYSGDVQLARAPWLHLNKACERFMGMDNNLAQYMLRPPAMMAQPGGRAYIIFDNKYEENIWKIQDDVPMGLSCKRPVTPDIPGVNTVTRNETLAPNDWRVAVKEAIDVNVIKVADTLEELAEKLGLDKVLFKQSVEKWNEYCAAGEDPEFGTPARFLIPIKHAPFYGIKAGGSMARVGCGLRTNPNMQVLDKDQKPIPGLYAAFFTAGGSMGEGRTPMGFGLLGGCSMSTTSGYTAAEHAASQK